jgi:hypothetical protein
MHGNHACMATKQGQAYTTHRRMAHRRWYSETTRSHNGHALLQACMAQRKPHACYYSSSSPIEQQQRVHIIELKTNGACCGRALCQHTCGYESLSWNARLSRRLAFVGIRPQKNRSRMSAARMPDVSSSDGPIPCALNAVVPHQLVIVHLYELKRCRRVFQNSYLRRDERRQTF